MIKVDFNPAQIRGSVLLSVDDLKNSSSLAVRLRNAVDPLSKHLKNVLSAITQQQLQSYDASQGLPDSLRDALIDELNELVKGSALYDRTRFKGTAWRKERETLMKALIKQVEEKIKEPKKDEGLACLNRLLMEEMYPEEIANSTKAEWEAWTLLADAAKARAIGEWEGWKLKRDEWKKTKKGDAPLFKPTFEDDVWKGFRDWLKKNVFNNKCAYCESKITGYPGDTEHFRPKGRVRVLLEDGTPKIVKIVDEDGEEMTHPGYFWLAYHWQNLLPSCEFCNTAGGKLDFFPVEKLHVAVKRLKDAEINALLDNITRSMRAAGTFYLEPRDLDKLEGRLLLHPYYDKPEDHIYFQVDGEADAWNKSKQGDVSIKVYNLNETTKRTARSQEQHDARGRYMSVLAVTDDNDLVELKKAAQKFMDEYYRGPRPYAAAVFDILHERFERTRYDPAVLLGECRKKS